MSEHEGPAVPKLLTVAEAAERLGLSASYLNKKRVLGGGPAYIRIGTAVRYDPADLSAWLASRRRASTSDTTGAAVA